MAIYLQTNTSSLVAEMHFNSAQESLQSSFTKLSSGYRINSAADDAAGLGIAKSLNAQVQSYNVASQNAADAVSMVQTADGSADQVQGLLTRMRELAVEAQNGTMSGNDLTNLDTEFQQDLNEIDRVAGDATFNGTSLLSGTQTTANQIAFQVGINGNTTIDQINVQFGGADTSSLLLTGANVSTAAGASAALASIDTAIQSISKTRAGFGAAINRLSDAQAAIQSSSENLSAALATIQDVNVASETANLAREQVLAQAGASVLAQANQSPQLALKLLQ
ncbi:MAG TPA: flagellin [Polyangiaceae bacterium]|nr:flagellin [Polyangiaceae bacterium]